MKEIRTAGQLREFLADTIARVSAGAISIEKASQIHKLAGQLTESLYAEVKAQQVQRQMGATPAKLGALPIGEQ